jgi:peptide/nickel transport system substrate-binding protein/oligopeptide transport system substrate-binding protein
MSSLDLYCTTCGAANTSDAPTCFACGNSLSDVEKNDEQASPPSSGTFLNNRYRLLSRVGEGGFAKVYRAEDIETKNIVAIKAISLKSLSSQEIIDATDTYNREIRFGKALKHPALPALLDHFMDQDHWYLVASFIEGETLEAYQQRLSTGHLPVWEVLDIGIQVCDVLSYLHSRQPPIIFRDVKPDNIMRTKTGHIYLVDFGIARQYRPGRHRDTQALGSPGYAAPEQYGSAQTTERSDIYSLGATLRALLTGINPLEEAEETAQAATMPADLSTLLSQMLERDPEKRPETIEIVKQRLESIAEKTGIVLQRTQTFAQPASLLRSSAAPIFPPTAISGSAAPSAGGSGWSKSALVSLALVVLVIVGGGIGVFSMSHHSTISDYEPVKPVETVPPLDPQGFVFSMNSSTTIYNLDPATTDVLSAQATTMLYSGLVQLDDSSQVKPQLASSWQQDADGTTWTFKLRPNLKFSDGSPLTSEDVAFSLDRALDPATHSPTASYALSTIKNADQRLNGSLSTLIGTSIIPSDPSTIKFITTGKVSFFPSTLTSPSALVINKDSFEQYGTSLFTTHLKDGGTSGPFQPSYYRNSERLDLIPNPYFSGPKPQIKKVSFVSNGASYPSDQLTMTEVSQFNIDRFKSSAGFHQTATSEITYFAMNFRVKPFDNTKIRQAFALALDKELLTRISQGDAAFATNHIIPQGQKGYTPSLKGSDGTTSLKGNLALAKKLLQEGMKEEGIGSASQFPSVTFTFSSGGSEVIKRELSNAQQMWQSVLGVTVQLRDISYQELINQLEGKDTQAPQLWRSGWIADYPDPQDWTTLQFGQGSLYNRVNYGQNDSTDAASQQQVQQALRKADSMPDNKDRLRLYQDAEQKLVNDVAWIPIYQQQQSYLLQSKVHDFTLNGFNVVSPDNWAKIAVS